MGQHILAGNPPLALTLRQSTRARRISLRISALDGKVTLTIPRGVPEREALEFARQKEPWLRAQLGRQPEQVKVGIGARVPIQGMEVDVVAGAGRRVALEAQTVQVPGAPERAGAKLQAWLKARARDELAAASDHFAAALGRPYNRISLRDTRSRWGSCTSDGGLMYSWRLILAPRQVLDYVAAHEVAHLAEMNHSPAFWANVARLYPEYEKPRRWLRQNGAGLHRYKFTD